MINLFNPQYETILKEYKYITDDLKEIVNFAENIQKVVYEYIDKKVG